MKDEQLVFFFCICLVYQVLPRLVVISYTWKCMMDKETHESLIIP